jgi:hypothetical protein
MLAKDYNSLETSQYGGASPTNNKIHAAFLWIQNAVALT